MTSTTIDTVLNSTMTKSRKKLIMASVKSNALQAWAFATNRVEYEDGERTMQLASVAMCFELAFKSDRPIELVNQDDLFVAWVVHRMFGSLDQTCVRAALPRATE